MKAGGLQRTNSLFWFMACHMTAKVHIISRRRAASSFARSLREFILLTLKKPIKLVCWSTNTLRYSYLFWVLFVLCCLELNNKNKKELYSILFEL